MKAKIMYALAWLFFMFPFVKIGAEFVVIPCYKLLHFLYTSLQVFGL